MVFTTRRNRRNSFEVAIRRNGVCYGNSVGAEASVDIEDIGIGIEYS